MTNKEPDPTRDNLKPEMTWELKKTDSVQPETRPDPDRIDSNPTRDLEICFGQTYPTRSAELPLSTFKHKSK
jgi:hypothetical protein